MFKVFSIELDIQRQVSNYYFSVSSNDLNTIRLDFIVKSGGNPFDLTNKFVRLAIKKPDGTTVLISGGVTNDLQGKCEVILSRQANLVPGKHEAEIMIFEGSETVAVTSKFNYEVKKSVISDKDIKSSSDYPALNAAIQAGEMLQEIDIANVIEAGERVDGIQQQFNAAKKPEGDAPFASLAARLNDSDKKLKSNAAQLADTTQDIKDRGINIKSFGAIGDGVRRPITNEDLQDINSKTEPMITLTLHVYDPIGEGGIYIPHITKNGVNLAKGDFIIKASDGTDITDVTIKNDGHRTLITLNSGTYKNVLVTYTADKFNVGDDWDTVGIQLAIESLLKSPKPFSYPTYLGNVGGNIKVPNGKYNLTKPTIITESYVNIIGEGRMSSVLFATENISSVVLFANDVTNCSIRDVTIDGNMNTTTKVRKAIAGLELNNKVSNFVAERVTIYRTTSIGLKMTELPIFNSFRDMLIMDTDYGVYGHHGVCQTTFETIRVTMCKKKGWFISGDTYPSYVVKFKNCITEFNGNTTNSLSNVNGMELRSVFDVSIDTCYFENNGTGAEPNSILATDPPCAIKLNGKDVDFGRNENITISNCFFSAHIISIYARKTHNLRLSNNTFWVDMVHGAHPTWVSMPTKFFDFEAVFKNPPVVEGCKFYSNISGMGLGSGIFQARGNSGIGGSTQYVRNSGVQQLINPEDGTNNGTYDIRDTSNSIMKITNTEGAYTVWFNQNSVFQAPKTIYLGNYALWVDVAGKLRIKNGTPTTDTDGTIVGSQA